MEYTLDRSTDQTEPPRGGARPFKKAPRAIQMGQDSGVTTLSRTSSIQQADSGGILTIETTEFETDVLAAIREIQRRITCTIHVSGGQITITTKSKADQLLLEAMVRQWADNGEIIRVDRDHQVAA